MVKKYSHPASIIITVISLTGIFIAVSFFTKRNPFSLTILFFSSFYHEHINTLYLHPFISPYISPISFFYMTFLLSAIILGGIKTIQKLRNKKSPFDLTNQLLTVAMTLLIIFVLC